MLTTLSKTQIACGRALATLNSRTVEEINSFEIGDYTANADLDHIVLAKDTAADLWTPGLDVVCLTDVRAKPINWLWAGRVALGKVTVLAGNGGLGKSTILCDWAARVSTGAKWPDGKANENPGSTIILSAEDAADDTLKPRLAAAGADMSKVFSVSAVREAQLGARRSFNLQADLRTLETEIARIGDVRLVIIDPISSYLGKVDSHKNADVRSVLEPLGQLATKTGCAIVCNNHFSKGVGGANSRVIGSVAFVNQARAAFIVTPDADDETRMLFIPSKMNIAVLGEGLAYRIGGFLADVDEVEIPTSQVCWEATPITISADAALAAFGTDPEAGSALEEAAAFLNDTLAKGPMAANEVKAAATAAGLSWATIRRAKAGIVDSKPEGPAGAKDRWKWRLVSKALNNLQGAHVLDMSILAEHELLTGSPCGAEDEADLSARHHEAAMDREHEARRS